METRVENTNLLGRWTAWAGIGGRVAGWCRDAGLELLFPATCAGCSGEIDTSSVAPLCRTCVGRLKLLSGPTCLGCGAAVPGRDSRGRCYLCRGTKLRFDEAAALGEYEGLLREWLLRMKDVRSESLTLALAEFLWHERQERLAEIRPDVVVPVPMHWRRRWARGTNSPALVAERLAQRLRVPLASGLLRRTRNTPPQFSLPPSERPANVRGAFSVSMGYHLEGARVLLVDDILTTGSTSSAAARTLKQHGAAHVAVAIIGRAGRRTMP